MTEQAAHSEYCSHTPQLRELPFNLVNFPRWALLVMIRGYQLVVSPVLPADTCRFYPTCSKYAFQAVFKFGALKGSWMAIKRVVRCNPFNPGGFDPVP